MTLLLESYFTNLIQTMGADHIVLICDAAATSSRQPPVSTPKTEEKKTRPSFNSSFSDLPSPPPSCPSRQVSIDGMDKMMDKKKNKSASMKKHALKDFFAEVAPKLSVSPTFPKIGVRGHHNSNNFSPMMTSNKMRGGSHQKKTKHALDGFLVEVEDLLNLV
jgi:hypothetical protein